MELQKRGRLYFSYSDSTNETSADVNVWQTFPYPSVPITEYRNSGHFTVSDIEGLTITYNGNDAWFDVIAVCNIYKGNGANVTRNIETYWEVNNVKKGSIRGSHMYNNTSMILSGSGQLYLQNGDVIKPKIRNIDNDNAIHIKNCDFIFKEDFSWGE